MSNDTKWIIGTVLSTAIALAGLMFAQSASLHGRMDRLDGRMDRLNARMDRLNARMDRLEDRLQAVEDRLRAVEIGLAEVRVLVSGRGQDPENGGQSPTVASPPRGG